MKKPLNEMNVDERYALQELARETKITELLKDVLFDMNVCRLEGWPLLIYPKRIKKEIDGIIERAENDRN